MEQLTTLKTKYPTWGPKKLWTKMERLWGQAPCSVRTLGRWLQRLNLVKKQRRRIFDLLPSSAKRLTEADRPNQVWTIDFKGRFWTSDGSRVDALTIRDLYSRFGLCVRLLGQITDEQVRKACVKIFRKYGLPKIIRVDNGCPFAGQGPYGFSSLSLWWSRLGIKVEFTRLACPSDNGAHEQFHRVYKAEVLKPPALNRALQQQKTDRWLVQYNNERPHDGIGGKYPVELYRKSQRRYEPVKTLYKYPKNPITLRVDTRGFIKWQNRKRQISRIVAGLRIALYPTSLERVEVYVDKIYLGYLLREGSAAMRSAMFAM